MTPEERELLTQSIKLAEENNKMLRSMRRTARFATTLRIIYWVFILGTAFGAYYFIQPYLNAVINGYSSMKDNIQNISNVTTQIPELPSWLGGKK